MNLPAERRSSIIRRTASHTAGSRCHSSIKIGSAIEAHTASASASNNAAVGG